MLLVVWWAWNYTTWVTNELDPESIVVRLMLIGRDARHPARWRWPSPRRSASGRCSSQAPTSPSRWGRHTFLAYGSAGPGTIERERAVRILTWFVASGALWIAGALADGSVRTALWLAALAIDYSAPRWPSSGSRAAPT